MRPFVIAGPCVVAPDEVMEVIANELVRISNEYDVEVIFKASFDKANRTSVNSYRGPGMSAGLKSLQNVKEKFGLKILTDIHECHQAAEAASVADIIQIPALLCRQTDLISAAARTGKIVNIKKGQFLSGNDMQFAVDKAKRNGAGEVWTTERGNSFGYNDLVVDFRNIPMMKQYADRVIMDCTHAVQTPNSCRGASGGDPEYIESMALAAKAFGAHGYFFEVYPDPEKAQCDSACSLHLDRLSGIVDKLMK